MLNSLLLAADEAANGTSNQWIMYVVIGVVLVLMIVLTIVPQKKRQKEQQEMMNSLCVGTKLMTVGGIVGKITQVNSDNTLIVNVGTENNPTLIVIDKKAVGYVLEKVNAPVVEDTPAEEAPAEDTTADSAEPETSDFALANEDAPVVEDAPAAENNADAE